MSETPIFDDVAAVYPEIQIDVHEEVTKLYNFTDNKPFRTHVDQRLAFNYMEPLPESISNAASKTGAWS